MDIEYFESNAIFMQCKSLNSEGCCAFVCSASVWENTFALHCRRRRGRIVGRLLCISGPHFSARNHDCITWPTTLQAVLKKTQSETRTLLLECYNMKSSWFKGEATTLECYNGVLHFGEGVPITKGAKELPTSICPVRFVCFLCCA